MAEQARRIRPAPATAGSVLRRLGGSVSSRVDSATSVANPMVTSVRKIARHPAIARTSPPNTGPSNGAMAMMAIKVDIVRAA